MGLLALDLQYFYVETCWLWKKAKSSYSQMQRHFAQLWTHSRHCNREQSWKRLSPGLLPAPCPVVIVQAATAAADRNSELVQACVSWLRKELCAAQIRKAEGKDLQMSKLPGPCMERRAVGHFCCSCWRIVLYQKWTHVRVFTYRDKLYFPFPKGEDRWP